MARFELVDVAAIVDLRHRVLRQGLPREAALFPGDELASSVHGAMIEDQRVVCCATFHRQPWESAPAWQLRGMATDPDYRGRGLGRQVLESLEAELLQRESGVRQLWCNARLKAVDFYRSLGWTVASALFEIPTAGPHHQMIKRMEPVPQRPSH